MYNLTFMENNTGNVLDLMREANNNIADGYFFVVMLFTLAVIAIVSLWNTDFKVASISVWFGLGVVSALLWAASLIPFYIAGVICVLLLAAILIKTIAGE